MPNGRRQIPAVAAKRALDRLEEMSVGLRAAAILDGSGGLLAASAEGEWAEQTAELWSAAAEGAAGSPVQVHVGTGDGEVYLARERPEGPAAVAVTDRFTLASLQFSDLRAALRDLEAASASLS